MTAPLLSVTIPVISLKKVCAINASPVKTMAAIISRPSKLLIPRLAAWQPPFPFVAALARLSRIHHAGRGGSIQPEFVV
jgi:hypothetical protein